MKDIQENTLFSNISNKLIYSLIATFSISIDIFFKKKSLLVGIPPINLLLQIMIIAGIVLNINLFLFHRKNIKEVKKMSKTELKYLFLLSISLFLAYFFSTLGLNHTTSINYSFINRSSLIFTSILAFFFLKEKMYWGKILLIFIFFIGIFLVTTGGKIIIPQIGDSLILMGAFFFSTFSVIQKKLSPSLCSEIIGWAITTGSTFLSIIASIFLKVNLLPTNGSLFILISGASQAIYILFMNKTIKVSNVTYYAMMTMLVPVISGFLGFFFLKESLNIIQFLGGFILIISGILVQRLRS